MSAQGWREDWRQFAMLNRRSTRGLLSRVSGTSDDDPWPFAIWTVAFLMSPLLLTAIRSTLRLSMTGGAGTEEIVAFIHVFRGFYVFYAMLLALLATAAMWDALLPDRSDLEIISVLPVRPLVLAASRLAAATRLLLLLALVTAVPVALTFGFAAGLHAGGAGLLRVIVAHVVTVVASMMLVFCVLVSIRGAILLPGSERMAERATSVLQAATLLLFVEAFVFLPGVMGTIVRAFRDGQPPLWCVPVLWLTAFYGWIAEGAARNGDVNRALLAIAVAMLSAVAMSLVPAPWLARRVQLSPARDRASTISSLMRALLRRLNTDVSVAGMAIFAAATLARSRRHALLLASYSGMGIAMASIGLLTAGFSDRFNLTAPRQDVLAVPLVAIFFVVFGLRAALERPADPLANWVFRIIPPVVVDGRRAARLLVLWLGVMPVLVASGMAYIAIWDGGTTLRVLTLDASAAFVLVELAFLRWARIPCGSLHANTGDMVKSRWPLVVLFLYLFAFRGADLQMYALSHRGAVWLMGAVLVALTAAIRYHDHGRGQPVIDVPDDGLALLQLSGSDV